MVEAIALEQAIKRDERPDAYPLMLQKLSYKTIAVEPKASLGQFPHKARETSPRSKRGKGNLMAT